MQQLHFELAPVTSAELVMIEVATIKLCVKLLKEVTIRGGGLKHVACAEDEDFIQALDKMMLENLQV